MSALRRAVCGYCGKEVAVQRGKDDGCDWFRLHERPDRNGYCNGSRAPVEPGDYVDGERADD